VRSSLSSGGFDFIGETRPKCHNKKMRGSSDCSLRLRSWFSLAGVVGLFPAFAPALPAAIIGTNPPAQPLTVERIAALPPARQSAWLEYLERSTRQGEADRTCFQAEMRRHGLQQPVVPPSGNSARSIPLNKPATWYGENEARRLADNIVSFQTPAGGWSKNLDLSQHPRAPGENFAPNNNTRFPRPDDFDVYHAAHWNYIGTFDNDATVAELRFLAKVVTSGTNPPAAWRAAFLHGLDYIFAAQYPNGGWPQVWPLQGGYHDAVTYNDSAMLRVLVLLRDVSETNLEFAFVPELYRQRAAASLQRGIACVLASQIVVAGRRTVWCQQHDPITLQPASARNYEMPAQSGAESAGLMMFLMQLPDPGPEITAAVNAAAAWFEKTGIKDKIYTMDNEGSRLVAAPGKGPVWARYYEPGTDRPIFGNRDKTIRDRLDEVAAERLKGYNWYSEVPQSALTQYAIWKKRHGQ
jgi:PelA/Pel-15E family pectate lyase